VISLCTSVKPGGKRTYIRYLLVFLSAPVAIPARSEAWRARSGGRFGPRKLRKVAKDAKICSLARFLFAYFVGFRDLRVPTPQEPPIRHAPSMVASSKVSARPGRSELHL